MWIGRAVPLIMRTMIGPTDMGPRMTSSFTRMKDNMGVKRIGATTRGKVVVVGAEATGRIEVAEATETETITIRVGATTIETIIRMVAMGVTMGVAVTTMTEETMIDGVGIEIRMRGETTTKMTDIINAGAAATISNTTRRMRLTTSLTIGCTMRRTLISSGR